MRYRNVIFDLDGTLVDSLGGIEASARHALGQCFPERTLPPMRDLVGPPIAEMFAQLWPELGAAEIDGLVGGFRRHYDAEGCLLSQLYPGVKETLGTLETAGAAMFVLTNKPRHASRLILQHLEILSYFRDVVSPDTQAPGFATKSEGVTFLARKHALEPGASLIVGDGWDDFEAAKTCGVAFLIAAYGYGSAARSAEQGHLPSAKTFPAILSHVL